MDVRTATFIRVYLDHFSRDEWRQFGLTQDEMNRLEGFSGDCKVLESTSRKLMKAAGEFWARSEALLEPVCSWEFNPHAFLPLGPYVCAITERSNVDAEREKEIRKYVAMACPWTASVQLCLVYQGLGSSPVISGSMISFEMPNGKHFRFKREDVLVIGDGAPRVGI